jgi:hypothetical protein
MHKTGAVAEDPLGRQYKRVVCAGIFLEQDGVP